MLWEKESFVSQLMKRIEAQRAGLTPKGRILADYIADNPGKAVFMTTRSLARHCGVSEATVVRFVAHLGYRNFGEFLQALRDYVDTELTILDRIALSHPQQPGAENFRRLIFEEIDNLKNLYESLDIPQVQALAQEIKTRRAVYVIGSRVSYTMAYYMGWALSKFRQDVRILKGSDSTCFDWLTIAPPESLAIIFSVSRYPNELLRLAKYVRRQQMRLTVITESSLCPLLGFAHRSLLAPSKHIPVIGSLNTITCLINFIISELSRQNGQSFKAHQEKLEQCYRENDILFNIDKG